MAMHNFDKPHIYHPAAQALGLSCGISLTLIQPWFQVKISGPSPYCIPFRLDRYLLTWTQTQASL